MKTPQLPHEELAEILGVKELYLKREDLHPYGSHKGRSIPVMIDKYMAEGKNHFVVSSSGNAAVAAAMEINRIKHNNPHEDVSLRVYVGFKIDPRKLQQLKRHMSDVVEITQTDKPKMRAMKEAREEDLVYLRQSTDKFAIDGYHQLAKELIHIPEISDVFVPTSSGTAAQGLAEYFNENGHNIAVHVVQTPACHPIATALGATPEDGNKSIAGAIVDKVAHRKKAILKALEKNGGRGFIVDDKIVNEAMLMTKSYAKIDLSPNSALSVAGLIKAVSEGFEPKGTVCCIVTGP